MLLFRHLYPFGCPLPCLRHILAHPLLAVVLVFSGGTHADPWVRCDDPASLSPHSLVPPFTLSNRKVCFPAGNSGIATEVMPAPYLYGFTDLATGFASIVRLLTIFPVIRPTAGHPARSAEEQLGLLGPYWQINNKRQQLIRAGESRTSLFIAWTDGNLKGVMVTGQAVSELQMDRIYSLLLDLELVRYLQALSADESLDNLLNQLSQLVAEAVAAAGDGGDDGDPGGDDQEPGLFIAGPYGTEQWLPYLQDLSLHKQSMLQKLRLLRILRRRVRGAIASGQHDLARILENRIMVIEADMSDLSDNESLASVSPAFRSLLLAGLLDNFQEVQAHEAGTQAEPPAYWQILLRATGRQVPNNKAPDNNNGGNVKNSPEPQQLPRLSEPVTVHPAKSSLDDGDGSPGPEQTGHTYNSQFCPLCNKQPCEKKVREKETPSEIPRTHSVPFKRAAKAIPASAPETKKTCPAKVNGPSCDTFFVNDDDEFSALAWRLLYQLQAEQEKTAQTPWLFVIQCPEDLTQGSLTRELRINANGVPERNAGLLFSNTPVTLLIDFRQFPPDRLPELNELFEKPARLEGHRLGSNVRIVTVISPEMVPAGDSKQSKPGPDFWWRINGASPPRYAQDCFGGADSLQTWLNQNIVELGNSLEPDNSPELMDTGTAETVIDFTGQDWRNLLLGTPGVDEKGRLIHQPGALEQLQAGQTLILKNAPWQDRAFAVQMVWTLLFRTLRCNGSEVQLPENLRLYRQPLSRDEIAAKARIIQWGTASPARSNIALVNQDNFAQVMHENVLTEQGLLCRRDMLAEWLKGCDGIRITSPLTESQWLQLASRLQKAQLQHLPVVTDVAAEQPPLFRGSQQGTGPNAPPMTFAPPGDARFWVDVEFCDGNSQLPLSASGSVKELVILPEQSLTKIAQRTEITSLQNRQFSCRLTQLVQDLENGTPVCLSGLQSNPVLLRQLEPLLCSPPHLLLFGQRKDFPKMQLTITWPRNRAMPSPVWQAFASGQANEERVKEAPEAMEADSTALTTELTTKQEPLQAFNTLYDTLGQLQMATYCPADPPGDRQQLFQKVLAQAESEREMDGTDSLHPHHYYQAVSSVILKEYRANNEVYSYLKHLAARLFLNEECNWIDLERLQEWLARHPFFVRETVKEQFWSLARAFPATMFSNQQVPEEQAVNELAAILVILAAGGDAGKRHQAREFAGLSDEDLSAAEQKLQRLSRRSLHREKTFYNRLAVLDTRYRRAGIIREQARQLAAAELQGEPQLREMTEKLLPEVGTDTELSDWLCAKGHNWQDWEQRRIRRLAEKVRRNPVVCIKGETGAGKSYIAEKVARVLNPEQPPQIMTTGPETELSDLLGRLVLKPSDTSMETGQADPDTDLHTEHLPAPLTLWAGRKSDKPVVLIIDEANLAIPELWNCLKGLYDQPPYLHLHGEQIEVSDQHRIIMTGNPDHFSGRRMNELLRVRAPQLYYPPLAANFIQEKVLYPGLAEALTPFTNEETLASHVEQLGSAMELLYRQYQSLLPGRVFTPRDLTDLISRVTAALAEHPAPVILTEKGLNGLAWQAFEDALGCEIGEEKSAEKTALKFWYEHQRPVDNSLTTAQQQTFEHFYSQWLPHKNKPQDSGAPLDYTNDSVRILMRQIWLEQRRSQHEKTNGTPHRGRHATVISGPAGRGKSALLDQQLNAMCQQAGQPLPRQINAGHSAWELIQQAVSEAKQQGYPLIISELNLLKSEEIEGLLNNAITGQAAPGFHLYTTVNPASFAGRHRFSPALKNRFTCLRLSEYTDQDIRTIASTIMPPSLGAGQREQLTDWHLGLRYWLKQKKVPLLPAVADLQRLRQTLEEEYPLTSPTPEQLQTIFTQQYRLFLTAGQCTLENLPKPPEATVAETAGAAPVNQLAWELNQLSLPQPLVVTRTPETTTVQARSAHHVEVPEIVPEIQTVSPDLSVTKQKALLTVALQDWEEQSQSQESPYAHDTLYSACYRLWQQNFIKDKYGLPDDLLPLTREQQATLAHPDNQILLELVHERLTQPPSVRGLQLLWEKLNVPVPEQKPRQMGAAVSPEQDQPPIKRPKEVKRPIDGETKDKACVYRVNQAFEDLSVSEQRMEIMQLTVSGSDIREVSLPTGRHGSDVICPEPLQAPVYTMGEEHYGVVPMSLCRDQYVQLPGVYPHQTITRLCTQPEIPLEQLEIVRDRGTGELLIRLKDPCNHELKKLTVHYVVKRQKVNANNQERQPVSTHSPFSKLIPEKFWQKFYRSSPVALMETLKTWGTNFKANEDVSGETDTDILKNIIRQQQGSCRHRAWAVFAIASAKGVPVRLVGSEVHGWVEYSANQGKTWEKVDFGGTGADSELNIERPVFKESTKGLKFNANEQETLLGEAISDISLFAKKMGTSEAAVRRWIACKGNAPLELTDPLQCFRNLILSCPPVNLRKAAEMVKSGLLTDREMIFCMTELAEAFAHVLEASQSWEESELLLELLYEMKPFLKATEYWSAKIYWFFFIEAVCGEFRGKSRGQQTLNLLSFAILKKNVLNELKLKDISRYFKILTRSKKHFSEYQLNNILPKVMAKFNERFGAYYPSVKAPVCKPVRAVSGNQAAPEIKGSAPSLEQRLKTTSIGSGFTWSPEGEVVVDRLLKQLAPFREQKAHASTRKVRLIKKTGGAITGHEGMIKSRIEFNEQNKLYDFIRSKVKQCAKNDKLWTKVNVGIYPFYVNPTQETMDCLLSLIKQSIAIIPPEIPAFLSKQIKNRAKVNDSHNTVPLSFAGYLEKKSKANSGNLGMYSLAKDETLRGYQLLTSKEAILAADSQQGKSLKLRIFLLKKHLQEEDSESLFIKSRELTKLFVEYCEHVSFDDL